MSSKRYSAIIVGAGRIGAGFDSQRSRRVLTHAHALIKHPRIDLAGIVDTDRERGAREARRWGVAYFSRLSQAGATAPDIIVIATPDSTHAKMMEAAAKLSPKVIVCEKPIVTRSADAARVEAISRRLPIIVNYSRRFDTSVKILRRDVRKGKFGKLIAANAIYTGGLVHNGSHAVDLFRYLFGDGKLSLLRLTEGDARRYSVFEVDLLMERGRIRFVEEGRVMEVQRVTEDPTFAGYRTLGPVRRSKTGLDQALAILYDHAVRVIEGKEKSACDAADAIRTFDAASRLAKARK